MGRAAIPHRPGAERRALPPGAAPAAPAPRAPRHRRRPAPPAAGGGKGVSKGFSLLEWTSALVPQGAIVTGAKQGWRLAWQTMVRELAPQDSGGAYSRPAYSFDGAIGSPDFPPEAGRYVLYLGNACGWCHRVALALALRGLSGSVRVVALRDEPERATRGGWVMPPSGDPVFGARDLWGVYDAASPGFRGRCTAPLLVDAKSRRAVCNESASIVRQLDALQLPGTSRVVLRPEALAGEIDALNEWIYPQINNGVYRCGFATTQAAYDAAAADVAAGLARADALLGERRFLAGDRCGGAPAAWLRDVWQLRVPGGGLQVRDTVDVDACRRSYYSNLFPLNPSGIIPSGPTAEDLQLDAPHGRGGGAPEEVFWLRPEAEAGGAAAAAAASVRRAV
ncbi:glutathione-dependent reductase [Raphidocelis subcapitata]|uniref:Glutathione-dependent reductase n=1 Tax=Raphidocelis subcapitata TaxID=307507 RepID=A0A2V0P5E1_9CHLO|nr:glutathione-dependent reductase [Raphidocelis subcapitata]|eukprot:GBF94142.1 glutathione-dependent reductase [Raphidocelis subcapitata]